MRPLMAATTCAHTLCSHPVGQCLRPAASQGGGHSRERETGRRDEETETQEQRDCSIPSQTEGEAEGGRNQRSPNPSVEGSGF